MKLTTSLVNVSSLNVLNCMICISDYVDLFFLIFTHLFLFSVLGIVFNFVLGDTLESFLCFQKIFSCVGRV